MNRLGDVKPELEKDYPRRLDQGDDAAVPTAMNRIQAIEKKVVGSEGNSDDSENGEGELAQTLAGTTDEYGRLSLLHLQSRVDQFHPQMLLKMIGPTIQLSA